MARDRQRAKARQRARAADGQEPSRPRRERSRARDIGLDDLAMDESGLTDDVSAPDPLKNASAEVDQAKAAETGAHRPPPDGEDLDLDAEGDDAFDRADDEVEIPPDLVRSTARGESEEGDLPARRDDRERGRVVTFLGACVDELRRVQWPDRKHVFQATAVVLGFVLVAGGWLGLMDALWQPLINAIL